MAVGKPDYPGNLSNLKLENETSEQKQERLSKAGKKSGESRRRKRNILMCMKMLLDSDIPVDQEKTRKTLAKIGIDDVDMTYSVAVCAAMMQKAIQGNVKAAEFVRDTAGFNPDILFKQEALKHQKHMDAIKVGQENVQKQDASELINALKGVQVE